MTFEELKDFIGRPERFREEAFEVLGEIAALQSRGDADDDKRAQARDLVIRCLERRDEMGDHRIIHDALLSRAGLYPYLENPDALPLADRLAYEAHRPLVSPQPDFVFHEMQAQIYARLMDGENVILTAPTSFGKTLIVDALVASGEYGNVVVIVPTIALIDEVRRRLARMNDEQGLGFKIVTHPGQAQAERNIFVFTQVRLLEEKSLPRIDLAVIDEFYKLRLDRDPQRGVLLNLALAKLRRQSKQLYLLGPSVGEVRELPAAFEHRYIPSRDSTVAFDVIEVRRSGDERADVVATCVDLHEPTLVYVNTPARAHEVARWLVKANIRGPGIPAAAAWVAETFHPDWVLVAALRSGIGIHHGRLPRALAHYLVSAFNDERLRFLICTQTLIEGVNTTAKNIVVVDDRIERRKLDLFSFRNIQGRSGRMFKHYVGRVFLFNPPPMDELPSIDIPALSQPDDAPPELLLGLPDDELTAPSRDRIAPYLDQDLVSVEVLRENAVDVEAQLSLAAELHSDPARWSRELAWRRFPQYEELRTVINLVWNYFPHARQSRRWGATSADQFMFLTWQAYSRVPLKRLIADQLAYWRQRRDSRTADDAVLVVLTFARSGLSFGLPKYLRVVDRIQADVLSRYNLRYGDYTQFAAAAEATFRPLPLAALDEYGVPLELADRLSGTLLPRRDATLDEVLSRLRELDAHRVARSSFELELLQGAQADI